MTTKPDDEIDRKAAQILQVVRQCWALLSDLEADQKAAALEKLRGWVAQEAADLDPAHQPERRH